MKTTFRLLLNTCIILTIGVTVSVGLVYFMPDSLRHSDEGFMGNCAANMAAAAAPTVTNSPVEHLDNQATINKVSANNAGVAPRKEEGVSLNVSPSTVRKSYEPQRLVRVSEVGKCLKAAREADGLKMADLKAATGLTEAQIINIENGNTVITPDVASDLEPFLKAQISFTK